MPCPTSSPEMARHPRPVALSPQRGHPGAARGDLRLARPALRRVEARRDPERASCPERHARGALQRLPRSLPRGEERPAPRRPDAQPLLPVLRRRRAGRRCRARLRPRDGGDGGTCPTYAACRGSARPHRRSSISARPANPQGAVADARYWQRLIGAGRAARFPHLRRRVLFGDLPRHAAHRRAGGRGAHRRRPGAAGGVPLAVQALEPRRDCARAFCAPGRPTGRILRCAPMPGRRCRSRRSMPPPPSGRTRRMSRPTARSTARNSIWRTRSSGGCRAMPRLRRGSSSGWRSATARRRRFASGARRG